MTQGGRSTVLGRGRRQTESKRGGKRRGSVPVLGAQPYVQGQAKGEISFPSSSAAFIHSFVNTHAFCFVLFFFSVRLPGFYIKLSPSLNPCNTRA